MAWTIKQSENKWYIFFTDSIDDAAIQYTSTDDAPVNYTDVCRAAANEGIAQEDLISEKTFEDYIKKNQTAKTPLAPLEIVLNSSFDARIIIAPDKTRADLYIRKAKDSQLPIDRKIIDKILANTNNMKKASMQSINEKIDVFLKSNAREIEIPIAEAILPQRGKNRTLITHTTALPQKEAQVLLKKLMHVAEIVPEQKKVIYEEYFPLTEAQSLHIVQKDETLFSFSKIDLGEAGVDIYGNSIPGLPGNDPFVLDMRNIVYNSDVLKAECDGILLETQTDGGLKIRIIPYKDATIQPIIRENNMEAVVQLGAAVGAGMPLSIRHLKKVLDDMHIPQKNYDLLVLEKTVYAARKIFIPEEYLICRGTLPVAPNSYRFDWKVSFDSMNITSVKKDMLMLELTFLEEGAPGIDVFDNIIAIDQAEPLSLPEYDDTVIMEKEGQTVRFIAAVSGEFLKSYTSLHITNVKIIDSDITEEMADVFFGGDLIVHGNIGENRKVKANGSLTIDGNADASLVYTKESLMMAGGIQGKYRGTVWAQKNINLLFAEAARLLASGDIHINQYCFRCTIRTNGSLSFTGGKGRLIGGNVHAACGVHVRNLGDKKKIRTLISFGQDYLVKDKIELYEREINHNIIEIQQIDEELIHNQHSSIVDTLHGRKANLLKQNKALTFKVFKLKEHFESHIQSEIRVTGTAYPGVILESHGRYYEVRKPLSRVVFTFDTKQGTILCKAIGNEEI